MRPTFLLEKVLHFWNVVWDKHVAFLLGRATLLVIVFDDQGQKNENEKRMGKSQKEK